MAALVLLAQQGGGVQFSVSASPRTVYVGQQVTYEAALSIREISPPHFLAGPEYTPSEIEGGVVYPFPFDSVRSIRHVTMDGARFTQYTYRSAIFPMTAGTMTIPPSTLTYTLLNEADPYASRPTTVHSAQWRVVVLPLPMQGRPADFSGAVGQFTLAAAADSQGLRTGQAFDLRLTVAGTGDIRLLQRPALTIPWATIVSTSESVRWDSTDALMHGAKEFRWLVTPRSGGHLTIPPTRYSYFNPRTKSYVTTVAAAIPLAIAGDHAPPPAHDRLSHTAFSRLWHTVQQRFVLVLGILVLASVIVWGAVRRHRTNIS